MAKITCPWCFQEFKDIEIQFRCINPSCKTVQDVEYAAYHRLKRAPRMQVTIDPDEGAFRNMFGMEADSADCPECGLSTSKKICPLCHNELPDTVGKYRHIHFAVVGSKEAGKSHYIAVLLNTLRHELGAELDASLLPVNDETIRRYTKDFYEPIFREQSVLDATRSVSSHVGTKAPLIFCLKLRKGGGNDFEVVTLVFFDTAGEDLDHVDRLQVEARYIANADGIIYLMDPLQSDPVRDKLSGEVLPDQHTEAGLVVNNIARTVRLTRGIDADKRIEIPFAFTMSKFDAVLPLLSPGSYLHEPSKHGKKFNKQDFKRVDGEVRSQLQVLTADSGSTEREVEHNFASTGFFAVSALGGAPDRSGRLALGVRPYRVADPFLWLLSETGIIKAK